MSISEKLVEYPVAEFGGDTPMDRREFEQGIAALLDGSGVLDAIAVDGAEGKGKISGPGVQNSPDQIDERLVA